MAALKEEVLEAGPGADSSTHELAQALCGMHRGRDTRLGGSEHRAQRSKVPVVPAAGELGGREDDSSHGGGLQGVGRAAGPLVEAI